MTTPGLSPSELLELYTVLGREVAVQESAHGALEAITRVALQAVRGADIASITRYDDENYTTVAPTGPAATTADALQYKVGRGPCLEALTQDTLVVSGDIRADGRWADWGPQASAAADVNSVLAVRLVLEQDEMLAALNIYSRNHDAFDGDSRTMATLLATHGALAVSRVIARERATNLAKAVTTNREIGMAMGVLMSAYKVTEDQAFDLLRIASQNTHRKIRDIAREVIETGTLELSQEQLSQAQLSSEQLAQTQLPGTPPAAPRSPGRNSRR